MTGLYIKRFTQGDISGNTHWRVTFMAVHASFVTSASRYFDKIFGKRKMVQKFYFYDPLHRRSTNRSKADCSWDFIARM
jgi:hypothetical protein